MEFPAVAAEQHPLATVYQQDNLVRHVGGQLQRQRTRIYNEMVASSANQYSVLFRAMSRATYGPTHPLAMSAGGTPEGIITAAAMKCMGGAMQGRLWPRDDEERASSGDIPSWLQPELDPLVT